MLRIYGEIQDCEKLRAGDSYTVLGCVRQLLAKLADGPMHLQIVRIDFAEYSHG